MLNSKKWKKNIVYKEKSFKGSALGHESNDITVCFIDLGKLNLAMVVRFPTQASFSFCLNCLNKWSLFQKWSKLTQK
jgi:hypothetical protein